MLLCGPTQNDDVMFEEKAVCCDVDPHKMHGDVHRNVLLAPTQ